MNLFLTEATSAAGGMTSTLIMLVMMLAVFYFMLIRPENKRKKEAEQMRSAVKVGDKITTIGGICGTVVSVKDDKLVIETSADQVRVELAKWAMSTNETAAEAKKAEAIKSRPQFGACFFLVYFDFSSFCRRICSPVING